MTTYYSIKEVVVVKQVDQTGVPVSWEQSRKYLVKQTLGLGKYGCYWISPCGVAADNYYEDLTSGYKLANRTEHAAWVLDTEHKRMLAMLSKDF